MGSRSNFLSASSASSFVRYAFEVRTQPRATFHWYAGPGFEKLGEELKRIYAENVERNTAESQILAVWVYAHQPIW